MRFYSIIFLLAIIGYGCSHPKCEPPIFDSQVIQMEYVPDRCFNNKRVLYLDDGRQIACSPSQTSFVQIGARVGRQLCELNHDKLHLLYVEGRQMGFRCN